MKNMNSVYICNVSYTSIMNNIALASNMIKPSDHESHHLQELIASNTSDLMINGVATDTEGANAVNFLLLRSMDIEFTPCYRNLYRRATGLVSFKPVDDYKKDHYIVKPHRRCKRKLITENWEEIKPYLAALLMKETKQSTIVRKLCSSTRKSKIKDAMWEFNAIFMTQYILRYIDDPILRGRVRTTLNRGEAYHQLRRRIAEANGGDFRGGSEKEIAVWNECGRLVANAIIFYNAYILSALMEKKEAEGDWEAVKFIRQLSPIACQHINFKGAYVFRAGGEMVNIDEILSKLDTVLQGKLS